MRTFRSVFPLAALAAVVLALAVPAPAAADHLVFVLHDLNQPGNPIVGEVSPGETLFMRPGERLRVSAVAVRPSGQEVFLPAQFWLSRSRNLAAQTRHTGVAIVEAGTRGFGRGVLHFELDGWRGTAYGRRDGELFIEVEDSWR